MTDEEITKDFIRVDRAEDGAEFFVCSISWDEPHTPVASWSLVSTFAGEVTNERIEAEVSRILSDRKHFARCAECSDLNPLGFMHDEQICQSCAQGKHRAIY
jgi:hypothetical protein